MGLKLNQTVKILASKKTDGRYNFGKIIGIEKYNPNFIFGYVDLKHFYNSLEGTRYKVAYQDCFTNRFCQDWYCEKELEKLK